MSNPLLESWDQRPYGLPPWERIEEHHFLPAFERALAEHAAEVNLIAVSTDRPDFANVVEALERAGRKLGQVAAVFFQVAGSDTTPAIQAIERKIAPKLAQHRSAILMNPGLFSKLETVVGRAGELDLDAEQRRVLDLYHRMFVRAGARLKGRARERMTAIMTRLAELGTEFSQNVLADEAAWVMWLDGKGLEGLPDWLVAAAAQEAKARKAPDRHAISLSRSLVEPFLTYSPRRDLREAAWRAWTDRGEGTNWPLIEEMVRLRAERARLLGFDSYAAWRLDDQMAKTPDAAEAMLKAVWAPARARAGADARALQKLAAGEGANIAIEPWDWRYYAEKMRRRDHGLDEAEIKPYLTLDNVLAAAFDVARRLFGTSFRALDVPLHNPGARAWEVTARDGAHLGVFVGDYFARPSKRSGAWASAIRRQQKLREPHRPVIVNTCNFAAGDPALLTWDDARTLFHEFGHGLHGLLSDVTYPFISGTSVERDFVELPSQLFEHWLGVPEILGEHARHYRTGEPMPAELIERIRAAERFGQGFATVEFTACALLDLEMHRLDEEAAESFDGPAFERAALGRIGMPHAIAMRHRTPHFQHLFSGDGYAAGYYSYMWSEMMDEDAFRAFTETGDPFDPATAEKLHRFIYSAGGRRDPAEAYEAFRGRMPGVEALLVGRGLTDAA